MTRVAMSLRRRTFIVGTLLLGWVAFAPASHAAPPALRKADLAISGMT